MAMRAFQAEENERDLFSPNNVGNTPRYQAFAASRVVTGLNLRGSQSSFVLED